jgi:hypothetical protein
VYPILLHHYAQTDLLRVGKYAIVDSVQVHGDCIKPVRDLIVYGLGRARSEVGAGILNALLRDLDDGGLIVFPISGLASNKFTNKLYDSRSLASMVIAGLLNEADGTIAKMNRNIR